jgi:hypothetical protein
METIIGNIYKIVADDTTNIYIGSTVQRLLCERFKCHKSNRNNTGSKILFTYPNTRIELIERYECESINKLREREQYHIEINKEICLNYKRAHRTKEQISIIANERAKKHYADNKEQKKKRVKEYRLENLEKIQKYKQEAVICDCGASVSRAGFAKHKRTNKHIELLNNKHKI